MTSIVCRRLCWRGVLRARDLLGRWFPNSWRRALSSLLPLQKQEENEQITFGGVQEPFNAIPTTPPVEEYLTFVTFAGILSVVPNNITPQGACPATTKG